MKLPRLLTITILFFFSILIVLPLLYILSWVPLYDFDIISIFESRHIGLIKKSLILAFGTTFFSLLLGVPSAFLIFQASSKIKKICMVFCLIPILIPSYIHAIVWNQVENLLGNYIPYINFHSLEGAIFILTLSYFSFIVLITLSGLQMIDRNLVEVALLSYDKFITLLYIVIPLLLPHIFAGATFVFVFSIIDFGVPDMLRLNVYPIEIFIQFSAFYNEKAAIILSLPIILLTIFIITIQKIYMKDRSYIHFFGGIQNNSPIFFVKPYCLIIVIPIFFLSSVLPIIMLIINAGNFSNYMIAWSSSKIQIYYSMFISAVSATCIVIFSFFLADWIERSSYKIKNTINIISMIPLAIPATTVGICMIKLWNQPVIDIVYSNSLIIILGYIVRFIPFGVIIITSGLKNISKNLEESAQLINSSCFYVLHNITIPLLKPFLIIVFFIIFILSFGELGTTVLIMPPGRETIPIKIFNLIHYGAYEIVSALCLIFILIILGMSVFLFFVLKVFKVKIND